MDNSQTEIDHPLEIFVRQDPKQIPEYNLIKIKNEKNGIKTYNGYTYIKDLGSGLFSKVKLVEKDNKYYSMKVINKSKLQKKKKGFAKDKDGKLIINSMLEGALKEIAILKKTSHPNIVQLHEILYDNNENKIYLILEYCSKGQIMEYDEDEDEFYINKNFYKEKENLNSNYTEDEIRHFIRQIVLGIEYLHSNGIIHRDIKPDNILINENNEIKITDFNVSAMLENLNDDDIGKKIEGNFYFRAPETVENNMENHIKGKPIDIWALGVTAYILAYKKFPFESEDGDIFVLFDNICKKQFKIDDDKINNYSSGFVNFLELCLEKDPNKRITIEDIKKLPWIDENCRNSLRDSKSPDIIRVSNNDIKNAVGFFTTVKLVKKIASITLGKLGTNDYLNPISLAIKNAIENIKSLRTSCSQQLLSEENNNLILNKSFHLYSDSSYYSEDDENNNNNNDENEKSTDESNKDNFNVKNNDNNNINVIRMGFRKKNSIKDIINDSVKDVYSYYNEISKNKKEINLKDVKKNIIINDDKMFPKKMNKIKIDNIIKLINKDFSNIKNNKNNNNNDNNNDNNNNNIKSSSLKLKKIKISHKKSNSHIEKDLYN